MRSLSILRSLVGFDTTSRDPNRELIAYVCDYLRTFDIEPVLIWNDARTKANLWATIGPPDMPGIILSGHTDVVPVDGQDWSSDPFSLAERDGRLFGRGCADMKGFLAAVLSALPRMCDGPLASPFHLAFSYDEEIGCNGVLSLIEHVRRLDVKPKLCLVGEPTKMRPVIGHKGGRAYRVKVRGKEAHSSLAPRAVNAIEYAAELIQFLSSVAREMAKTGPRDDAFDIAHSTLQTGMVHGGIAINVVPRDCEFVFEFRYLAETDPDGIMAKIREFASRELEPRMRMAASEAGVSFEPVYSYPALETPRDEVGVEFVKKLLGRSNDSKVAFGTEGGLFSALGIPTVVCGPGSIVEAHKPDEFVSIEQITRCEAFLARLTAVAFHGIYSAIEGQI